MEHQGALFVYPYMEQDSKPIYPMSPLEKKTFYNQVAERRRQPSKTLSEASRKLLSALQLNAEKRQRFEKINPICSENNKTIYLVTPFGSKQDVQTYMKDL